MTSRDIIINRKGSPWDYFNCIPISEGTVQLAIGCLFLSSLKGKCGYKRKRHLIFMSESG